MRRNLYILAFVAVLLVACAGGFIGGRVLLARLQSDFTPRTDATPAPDQPTAIAQAEAAAPATAAPQPTEGPRTTPTTLVVAAPVTDQPAVLTPELTPAPTWTAGVEVPTSEFAAPDETPLVEDLPAVEPSATPVPNYPFVLARPVRYSSNDCPGTYALGLVTDRSGSPMAGVRLKLVDEFGNPAVAVTKPGPGDTGRYDFPMGGPGRKFYMTVIDEAERPLSPEVEILHDLAPYEGQNCRWVDWRRTQ